MCPGHTNDTERRDEAGDEEAPVPEGEEARLGVEGQVAARTLRVVVGRAELRAGGAEGPAGDDAGDHFSVCVGRGISPIAMADRKSIEDGIELTLESGVGG